MYSTYQKIKNDNEIIEIYEQVKRFEEKEKGWAHHGYSHVLNVANLVKEILEGLNYDIEFIEEAQIAAILHDTGCVTGKNGHSLRSYEYAKNYLSKNDIYLKYENLVLEAIKNHSNNFETNNIIALSLIFADKLDIKKDRITSEGCKVIGNRQYQYINDIIIKIVDSNLEIRFYSSKNIDLKELEEYYFTMKVFNAIKNFSKKVKLVPNVFMNNEKWESFYSIS